MRAWKPGERQTFLFWNMPTGTSQSGMRMPAAILRDSRLATVDGGSRDWWRIGVRDPVVMLSDPHRMRRITTRKPPRMVELASLQSAVAARDSVRCEARAGSRWPSSEARC